MKSDHQQQMQALYSHAASRAYALQVLQRLLSELALAKELATHGLNDSHEAVVAQQWDKAIALVVKAAGRA